MLRKIFYTSAGKLRLPIVIIGSFFITFFGLIPGFSLPGLLMLGLGDTVLRLTIGFFGYSSVIFSFPEDGIFSFSIPMSLSLFPFLIIAYILAFRVYGKKSRRKQWGVWMLTLLCWSILGTVLLTSMVHSGAIVPPNSFENDLKMILNGSGTTDFN
jgi:hypothetical protein